MVKLAKLKEKTMASKVTFVGETLNFEYKPGSLRAGYYDSIRQGIEDDDQDAVTEAFCMVMVSWDLEVEVEELAAAGYYEDEDGDEIRPKPNADTIICPIDPEALKAADIPMPLYGMINAEIRDDATNGGRGTKKGR